MKNIKFISISYVVSNSDYPCDVCPLARQTRLPFHSSKISTNKVFDLIHIDTSRAYKTPTYNGYRYFLTIVDDFSRATWTYLLSTKSNAFSILKNFLAMIERQFNTKVKVIRLDNALELGGGTIISEFFLSQGIIHQTSCIATP